MQSIQRYSLRKKNRFYDIWSSHRPPASVRNILQRTRGSKLIHHIYFLIWDCNFSWTTAIWFSISETSSSEKTQSKSILLFSLWKPSLLCFWKIKISDLNGLRSWVFSKFSEKKIFFLLFWTISLRRQSILVSRSSGMKSKCFS